MRELKNSEIAIVSGGSLTTFIMGFFRQLNSSTTKEKTDWVRPENIPAATPVSGEVFGRGVVTALLSLVFGSFMI